MTVAQTQPIDLTEWEGAYCRNCGLEVTTISCVDLSDESGWEGPSPYVTHIVGRDSADNIEPTDCAGPVIEAMWAGRYLIDAKTGEVLDVARPQGFAVTDQSSAEWVLERIFDAEAEATALEQRKRTLIENVDRMKRDQQRRADWLRERFGSQLEAWATAQLEGKKTRTLRTPFGTLSFRKSRPRVVVDDEVRAIEACRDRGLFDAVKVTESLLVSMLPKDLVPAGCHVEPARDVFKIDCGTK